MFQPLEKKWSIYIASVWHKQEWSWGCSFYKQWMATFLFENPSGWHIVSRSARSAHRRGQFTPFSWIDLTNNLLPSTGNNFWWTIWDFWQTGFVHIVLATHRKLMRPFYFTQIVKNVFACCLSNLIIRGRHVCCGVHKDKWCSLMKLTAQSLPANFDSISKLCWMLLASANWNTRLRRSWSVKPLNVLSNALQWSASSPDCWLVKIFLKRPRLCVPVDNKISINWENYEIMMLFTNLSRFISAVSEMPRSAAVRAFKIPSWWLCRALSSISGVHRFQLVFLL